MAGLLTMPVTIALLLDLPEVRVLASRMLEDTTRLIQVESTWQMAPGHRCGREIDRFHGFDPPIRLRHLPVFRREVVIGLVPRLILVSAIQNLERAQAFSEQAQFYEIPQRLAA